MANLFQVNITTAEEVIFEGKALSLVVPAELGFLGILANHAPLIANLKSGKITIRDSKDKVREFNSGGDGFVEVLNNQVTLLLDKVLIPAP